MNLDHMLAQLRGTLPSVVLQPDCLPEDWPTCAQRRCRRPAAIKKNGEPAKSCQACLDRRAASCRRRRAALAAEGGCRRCAYCKRLEGDFHGRSRGDRPVPARRAPRLGAAQSPAARRRRHRTDGEPAGKVRPVGRVRVRVPARRGGGARPPAQKGARWLPPRRRPVSLHQAKCLVCPENASNRNLTMISGLDFRTRALVSLDPAQPQSPDLAEAPGIVRTRYPRYTTAKVIVPRPSRPTLRPLRAVTPARRLVHREA